LLEVKMPRRLSKNLKPYPIEDSQIIMLIFFKSFNFKGDANSVKNADSDPLNIRTLGQIITF